MSDVRHAAARCGSLAAVLVLAAAACAGGSRAPAGDTAGRTASAARAAADSVAPSGAADTAAAPTGTGTVPDSGAPRRVGAPPAAAGSTQASPSPRATPSETVMTGKVVAGGLAAEPVTTLQVEGGRSTTLVGPLEPELRRLGGATVWVAGEPGGRAPNASFTVSRYDIVSIDGAKPAVGTLVEREGGMWLTGRDTVKLASLPAALRAKAGARVWIVGRRTGAELVVQSYGIIREP